ncbi:MAG: hypothetical protein ACRDFS_02350, partial [Chloroflexota bacterium]
LAPPQHNASGGKLKRRYLTNGHRRDMNEHLRAAVAALAAAAADIPHLRDASAIRERLRSAVRQVDQELEADDAPEGEDVIDDLRRKSLDIADDLRRADRLMRERLGRE